MLFPTLYPRAKAAVDRKTHTIFDIVGILPTMLSELDPRPAVVQLNENYAHGGGWRDFQGFKFIDGDEPKLLYPGDPPTEAVAFWQLRNERIILFDNAWVAVVQPDGSNQISRMD